MPSPRRAPRSLIGTPQLVLFRELAADANAKDDATFGEMVDGRDLLGHERGVAQRQQINAGAEHEAAAGDGGLRDLQQRVEERDSEGDVVAAPERVEAEPVDLLDRGDKVIDGRQPRLGRRFGPAVHGLDADLQLRL